MCISAVHFSNLSTLIPFPRPPTVPLPAARTPISPSSAHPRNTALRFDSVSMPLGLAVNSLKAEHLYIIQPYIRAGSDTTTQQLHSSCQAAFELVNVCGFSSETFLDHQLRIIVCSFQGLSQKYRCDDTNDLSWSRSCPDQQTLSPSKRAAKMSKP